MTRLTDRLCEMTMIARREPLHVLLEEAADQIGRLRSALKRIESTSTFNCTGKGASRLESAIAVARAALRETE